MKDDLTTDFQVQCLVGDDLWAKHPDTAEFYSDEEAAYREMFRVMGGEKKFLESKYVFYRVQEYVGRD